VTQGVQLAQMYPLLRMWHRQSGVIVTDGIACPLPDMLLRGQVGTGRREVDHLQAIRLLKQGRDFAIMPGGTIQQE
jgi:hypothetical protein